MIFVACAASIMIYLADKFGNEELLPKVWRVCRAGFHVPAAVLANAARWRNTAGGCVTSHV